jgi:hypothetical protein
MQDQIQNQPADAFFRQQRCFATDVRRCNLDDASINLPPLYAAKTTKGAYLFIQNMLTEAQKVNILRANSAQAYDALWFLIESSQDFEIMVENFIEFSLDLIKEARYDRTSVDLATFSVNLIWIVIVYYWLRRSIFKLRTEIWYNRQSKSKLYR